eukprot:CAMPEP_0202977704 /NCGR_PEP_ID=MMETSP1396-20130829/84405_1 /ASSEMBLY_ACC=CAM_ASM_000872 /TAXON_ID= /ORGANISM="Pseudokeronopsis sp., Strain Brazil" /LENGTH=210 /DNA_ID=CAMNT_0049716497 /DNA_START=518 /DNA_END=1152 /DNA_ORIENTATION=+
MDLVRHYIKQVLRLMENEDKLNFHLFKLFEQQQKHRTATNEILQAINNIEPLPTEIMDQAVQRAATISDMSFILSYESLYYLRKCSTKTHTTHEHPCKKSTLADRIATNSGIQGATSAMSVAHLLSAERIFPTPALPAPTTSAYPAMRNLQSEDRQFKKEDTPVPFEDKLNFHLFKLFEQQQKHRSATYEILQAINKIEPLPTEIMDQAV